MENRSGPGRRGLRRLAFTLALLVAFPAAEALAVLPTAFDQLEQDVIDFQNGMQGTLVAADCMNDPEDILECNEIFPDPGGTMSLIDSGWDIRRACYTLDASGLLQVGFLQGGRAGDGDGDGDPDAATLQFDQQGIGPLDVYRAAVDVDFNLTPDFIFTVTETVVGDFTNGSLGPATGTLCEEPMIGPLIVEPCAVAAGPMVGNYTAGTTGVDPGGPGNVTNEVLLEVDTSSLSRAFDMSSFRMVLNSGSLAPLESCEEDQVSFTVVTPEIEVEKDADGVCVNEEFRFSADYVIENATEADFTFASVELLDQPAIGQGTLGEPTCAVIEGEPGIPTGPLAINSLGNGAWDATLGSLDAGGSVTIRCEWPPVPTAGFDEGDSLAFANDFQATALDEQDQFLDEDSDTGAANPIFDQSCIPGNGGGMRKEHEGVGFDNLLSLTPDLPLGNTTQYGSGVFPGGEPDVDRRENFTAQGALAAATPGVYTNVPRIPPGTAGVQASKGFPALFTWRMLVSNIVTGHVLDVSCSLCAEQAWRDDHSPAQTFTPRGIIRGFEIPYLVANEPVMMEVVQICGPNNPLNCGTVPLQGVTTPGLVRFPTERPYNYLEFLGCKPKTILIENPGSFFPGDLIEVRVFVPGTERARVFADVTSCEAAYLTNDPLAP